MASIQGVNIAFQSNHRPPAVAVGLLLALYTVLFGHCFGARAEGNTQASATETLLPNPEPWLGDFAGIRERRLLRILVPYSKTIFFVDRATLRGTAVDFGNAVVQCINRAHRLKKARSIKLIFIPTPRSRLFTDLNAGLGDIAAGNLTVTPERMGMVDFTKAWLEGVKEVVVTGPGAPPVATLDDLGGKKVYIRRSSSFWEHLIRINEARRAAGRSEIVLDPADEDLEGEDILEMVNAGLIPMTVVDDHIARFWQQIFPDITVHNDILVSDDGDIAWAVRKQSPELRAAINNCSEQLGKEAPGLIPNVFRRYLKSVKYVVNSTSREEMQKYQRLVEIFRKYADQYDMEYLMLLAQGYQESRLDQSARSPRGAVGIMQLLPSTASAPPISIRGVDRNADNNIHAGAKYLRHLIDQYLDDPALDEKNRLLMAFAAYNAGPGNLSRFRRLAAESGLDPNVWFYNVELAAAKIVGQETVHYVSSIYKYYIAYKAAVSEQSQAAGSATASGQ